MRDVGPDVTASAAHDHVVHRFATACGRGDHAALAAILAADVVAVCDGGGKVLAPVHPIRGATEVAGFLTALLTGAPVTVEAVNGRTGLTIRRADRAVAVVSVNITGAEVTAVWIVLNPDKLHGWPRLG